MAMNHGEAAAAPPDEGESDSAGAAVVRGHRPAPSAAPHPLSPRRPRPRPQRSRRPPRFGGAFSGSTPRPQVFLNATSTDLARRPPASFRCRPAHDRVRVGLERPEAAPHARRWDFGLARDGRRGSAGYGPAMGEAGPFWSERLTMPANHALLPHWWLQRCRRCTGRSNSRCRTV